MISGDGVKPSVCRRLFTDDEPSPEDNSVEDTIDQENLARARRENSYNQMWEALAHRDREAARARWNFDFETETPLDGDWEWEKVEPETQPQAQPNQQPIGRVQVQQTDVSRDESNKSL
ncbi:hypothetical protein CBL_01500 [Carabus blaptoides fortunei]